MKVLLKSLFEHEHWANQKLSDLILSVTTTDEKVLSLFAHIVEAQALWIQRIKGLNPEVKVWEKLDRCE
jgi:uncharacterized damage-inducible protein DinB